MTSEDLRLLIENEIMDGIAAARRACPDAIPFDAEWVALDTLRITPVEIHDDQ